MVRFYHAFKWQTVVEAIKNKTKGIVLIASPCDGDEKVISKLTPEERSRVVCICPVHDYDEAQAVIYAANKPSDKTWIDWIADYESASSACANLGERTDALHVSALILMDHPNRTKNLHRLFAETKLTIVSSTEKHVKRQAGTNGDGEAQYERIPDVRWLYGRPSLPEFDSLTDEMFDRYQRDGVSDLDDLIPVYDFSVQSDSHKQLLDEPPESRAPLVLLDGQPMLCAESITELFAWRATGKTLFSLSLGVCPRIHLAPHLCLAL